MKVRDIFKPDRLVALIFLLQFTGYFLYASGIVKSYRISYISNNIYGYVCVLLFYTVQSLVLIFAEKARCKRYILQCIDKKKIARISIIYMLLAFIGFSQLTVDLIRNYSIGKLINMILRNRQVEELVYGSGNTILCNFAIASLMLLSLILSRNDKKTIILWVSNFVFLVVYASFLSSRILILQGVLFSILIFARRHIYTKKIDVKVFWIVGLKVVFLVFTSGFRDYDQMGYRYTKSKFDWGISRVEDYLISTVNTSLEIDAFTADKPSSFPENTLQLFDKIFDKSAGNSGISNYSWRTKVSAGEYTNVGAFAQIYSDWRLLFIIPVFVIAVMCLMLWKHYDKGLLSGYLIWPLFFYNIVEMWRINYLGTAMAEVLLLICCFTCIACRKDFVCIGEQSDA